MKILYLFFFPFFLLSCKKNSVITQDNIVTTPKSFSCQNAPVISYSSNILPLFQINCNNCHATPGSGGINLDSYFSIKQIMLSGQVMPVVTNTDVNSIMMPPPPRRHLDSCEIKTLNLWITQGCLNN